MTDTIRIEGGEAIEAKSVRLIQARPAHRRFGIEVGPRVDLYLKGGDTRSIECATDAAAESYRDYLDAQLAGALGLPIGS